MRHHVLCKLWSKFHPYDCPECRMLNEVAAGNYYSDDDIEDIKESARTDGYEEAEDDMYWERESEKEEEYDRGFKDGKQKVLENPESYGLVEEV